ncbi:hypothetical protein O181_002005 [Austropuccinia psidii MF-1]|uniref:Uncharacterized protein n=1 Tax=Austropuccinia psidii MF-1 TaxID=1389203 RepID=A0A9Q3BBL5_9BASI|nr:hypothetical protein [Austropuccinia psidii MF-1]
MGMPPFVEDFAPNPTKDEKEFHIHWVNICAKHIKTHLETFEYRLRDHPISEFRSLVKQEITCISQQLQPPEFKPSRDVLNNKIKVSIVEKCACEKECQLVTAYQLFPQNNNFSAIYTDIKATSDVEDNSDSGRAPKRLVAVWHSKALTLCTRQLDLAITLGEKTQLGKNTAHCMLQRDEEKSDYNADLTNVPYCLTLGVKLGVSLPPEAKIVMSEFSQPSIKRYFISSFDTANEKAQTYQSRNENNKKSQTNHDIEKAFPQHKSDSKILESELFQPENYFGTSQDLTKRNLPTTNSSPEFNKFFPNDNSNTSILLISTTRTKGKSIVEETHIQPSFIKRKM